MSLSPVQERVVTMYVRERITLHPRDYEDTDKLGLDYWHMLSMLKQAGDPNPTLGDLMTMRSLVVAELVRQKVAERVAKRLEA